MTTLGAKSAAAFVVLVVAACGGGSSDSTAPTTEEATATTEERTTTTEKTATVEQVASVVAEHDRELVEAMDKATPCTVILFPEDCDLSAQLSVLTAGLVASTLETKLDAFNEDRPDNQLYTGSYPEELEPLVEKTLEAARRVEAASEDWDADCSDDLTTEPCTRAGLAANQAFESMEQTLDSWRPYL